MRASTQGTLNLLASHAALCSLGCSSVRIPGWLFSTAVRPASLNDLGLGLNQFQYGQSLSSP